MRGESPLGLADGGAPRGLTKGGWVRTTGWLQVGDRPVSSVYVAATVGLLWAPVLAVAVVPAYPVVAGILVVTAPVVSGAAWWVLTTWLRPSSSARNVGQKPADDLAPGDVVRLHGTIGPVGQVAEVKREEDVLVVFHGGGHLSWASCHVVHIAELLS